MKIHIQSATIKTKKLESSLQNKKKSQMESSNEIKKKTNSSPQKMSEAKKHDKINNNSQQISDSKDNNQKAIINNSLKPGNIIQTSNFTNNNNHKKSEDIKDRPDKKKIENIQALSKEINSVSINLNDSKDNIINSNNNNNNNLKKTNKINSINIKINEKPKEKKIEDVEIPLTSPPKQPPQPVTSPPNDENFYNQLKENDKKLKDTLQAYNNLNKKSEGASLNTLFKLRSILINWLKDSDQDLEYTKFMTEKKLKYLMKNKEKSEARIKVLDTEIKAINVRKEELEKILGEIYCFYDEEGLKEDIKRFENSNEVKSGKFSKTLEQLETMKKMLPYVSEYGKIKDSKTKKYNEKKELEKIVKSSGQTLVFLSNYYKNIKKKINEQINNI